MPPPDRAAGSPIQPAREVSRKDLFLGFLKIGMLGFGGLGPWARFVIVEERGWLTEAEYAAVLGVGQVLPGPNIMNASVMIGDRFQGVTGALLGLAGLMAVPLAILMVLAQVYASFLGHPLVQAALAGSAAAAAGLIIGTAAKMALRLKPSRTAVLFGLLAVVAVALLHWPLWVVLGVVGPLSVAGAAWERRA